MRTINEMAICIVIDNAKAFDVYIHTYIIGHYNPPSVRIIDLVSHSTYVVCVLILYISGGTYSLKSTLNDRFFEKLFMAILFILRNQKQKQKLKTNTALRKTHLLN